MKLPSLEEYINTFQLDPVQIFSDKTLKNCEIEKNSLGLPRNRSGNFASIFKIQTDKEILAIRCFLKMSKSTQKRYSYIKSKLENLDNIADQYSFTKFDFQEEGIRVNNNFFPIIRMSWVDGMTLGEFIYTKYRDAKALSLLQKKIRELFFYLHSRDFAHGDIQPGNIIVSKYTNNLILVDYDGMFIPEIDHLGSHEIGHINFQHPKRTIKNFSKKLDFFSFILLDVSLECLKHNADLWDQSFSDEEGILFRAEDLRNPLNSPIFYILSQTKNCHELAQDFASICLSSFENIPNPKDFYSGYNTEKKKFQFHPIQKKIKPKILTKKNNERGPYLTSNKLLNANNSEDFFKFVGKRVEIVGKIFEVRIGKKQFEQNLKFRPYIFLDFNSMEIGKIIRAKILPDVIETYTLSKTLLPDEKWVSKWVTLTQTIQPIQNLMHPSFPTGIKEISLVITNLNQIRILSQSEAYYRLGINSNLNSHDSKTNNTASYQTNKKKNENIINVLKNL